MIEAIRHQGRRVEIDQAGQTYVLHELIYLQLSPEVGDTIDLDQAVFSSQVEFAFDQAANYVISRMKSGQQVRDYLIKKGYPAEAAEAALERLMEHGLIDDQAYASAYIESFHGQRGHNYLRQKLWQRGIREVDLPEEDPAIVCDILERRWPKTGKMELKERKKAHNFLLSRGFSYETIKKAFHLYENTPGDD